MLIGDSPMAQSKVSKTETNQMKVMDISLHFNGHKRQTASYAVRKKQHSKYENSRNLSDRNWRRV